jgi:hypothetical protein
VRFCQVTCAGVFFCNLRLVYSEYSSEYGDCWPMDSERRMKILNNYRQLVQLLHVDVDLIDAIMSRNCFTDEQMSSIQTSSGLGEQSRKLLDLFIRSSVSKFKQFIECLDITQPHIVPLLTENTGIICRTCYLASKRSSAINRFGLIDSLVIPSA